MPRAVGAPVVVGAAARGLDRILADARGRLIRYGVLEAAAAGVAASLLGLLLAAVLVGVLPFSHGLRISLLGFVATLAGAAAGVVVRNRLWVLRHDLVVAARIEEALARSQASIGDAVRGAVELRDVSLDGGDGRSRALCDAHISATVERVRASEAQGSLLGVALERAVPTLLSLAVAVFLVGGWAVLGQGSLQGRLLRLFDSAAIERALEERAASLLPLVTDLTLTLRFPAYMGEADLVTPGASGDITAPRGTEVLVSGRADRMVTGIAVILSAGAQESVSVGTVSAGREVQARFVVDAGGSWRFRLEESPGSFELDPVAHKIVLRADQPPVAKLDAPDSDLVVQLEDELPLSFSAEDDYGLTKIRVAVKRQGTAHEPWTKDLLDVPSLRATQGSGTFKIADSGARPGDKLSIYIEAVDNDTISGGNVGRSQTRVLTVFSAAEHHREVQTRLEELVAKMVDSLGDELETPFVGGVSADAQVRILAVHKGIAARGTAMLDAFEQVLLALADDEMTEPGVRRALANIRLELGRRLEQKTKAAEAVHADGLRDVPLGSWRRLADLQDAVIQRLEKDIVYIDDLIQQQRIAETKRLMADMKRAQEDIKQLLTQYKESGDPAARDALLAEIKRMQDQMATLAARLAELRREVPDEFLNEEAFHSDDMMQKAASLDELIEEGKLEDAQKALESMLSQSEKMVKELENLDEEVGGEEYKELKEKLQRFSDELTALEAGQQEALKDTERLLEAASKKAEDKLKGKLQQALQEARKKVERAKKKMAALDQASLVPPEEEDVDAARARVDDLDRALQAGDLEDALKAAEDAEAAARSAEMSIADRMRARFGPRTPQTLQTRDLLEETTPLLQEVREQIAELMPDPSSMLDAAQRQRLQRNADRQQQLAESAEKLSRLMSELGEEAPIFGPEHKGQLNGAGDAMQRAMRQLKTPSLRGARSSQSQALQRLGALKQALQQMGEGGQGGGMPMPLPGGGSPGGEPDGHQGRHKPEAVKIPDGSQFKVPDAHRKDILDAMREGAPDDWTGEVKKYYEELIK